MTFTDKQKRFVEEYLIDLNATQAAIRAGYSKKSARTSGHENLHKAEIRHAIQAALDARSQRVKIDADYVLKRLVEIDKMDVADILDDQGAFRPLSQWPATWRRFISALDVAEMYQGTGSKREKIGLTKKIKWPDKLKNLELLGRHMAIQAFKEQKAIKVEGDVSHKHQNLSDEELEARIRELESKHDTHA